MPTKSVIKVLKVPSRSPMSSKDLRPVVCLLLAATVACDGGRQTEGARACPPAPGVEVCDLPRLANTLGVDITNVGFDPPDVLYRHAAQVNASRLQEARERYRRENPNCPFPGVRLVQTSSSPPCPRRSDFTDDQMTGLRVAQGLNQASARWWEILPDCPCREADVPQTWTGGAASQTYHPGAARCYRSPAVSQAEVVAAGLDPRLRPGQQCCYDARGRLITGGAGAGTPDLGSPSSALIGHMYMDVETFRLLGWRLYTMYWPPNKDSCEENIQP